MTVLLGLVSTSSTGARSMSKPIPASWRACAAPRWQACRSLGSWLPKARLEPGSLMLVMGSTDPPSWLATVVHTTLITASREHVAIDYRLREESGRWMIVDISIENVSLVNHFRKTFSSALANMTIDQLIDRLEKQLPATN